MATISPRRYYLLKRRHAETHGDAELASSWRAKQEAIYWPALPSDWPTRSKLSAVGYTTVRDLDGADLDELTALGLTRVEAQAVLDAMAKEPTMIPTTLTGYTRQDGKFAATYDAPLVPSAARTATFTSDTYEMGGLSTLRLLLDVTAASGTTPTLDVVVETSHDGVNNWRSLLTFEQKTTTGQSERQAVAGSDRFVRAVCTIGGTTPSFTFSLTGEAC